MAYNSDRITIYIAEPVHIEEYSNIILKGYTNIKEYKNIVVAPATDQHSIAVYGKEINKVIKCFDENGIITPIENDYALFIEKPTPNEEGYYIADYLINNYKKLGRHIVFDGIEQTN